MSERIVKFDNGGVISERVIAAADWKKAGVEDMGIARWNLGNRFVVDASDWPLQALEVVKTLEGFKVVEDDVDSARSSSAANTPNETGETDSGPTSAPDGVTGAGGTTTGTRGTRSTR